MPGVSLGQPGGGGITQSGASQAISQMEETLGVALFVRDRRTTRVTAVGVQVIEHARRMLIELEAIQHLAEAQRGPRRRLRLACFPSAFTELLPELLLDFARLYPDVEVLTLHGTDEEVERWLASGSVDIGVVMNPSLERDAVSLGRDRWVVAARHHWFAGATKTGWVTLADIVDQPFIVATGGCHLHGQTLVDRAGLRLSDVRMTVSDWATAYTLVAQGVGLAIVPESTLPAERSDLQVLHLTQPIYRMFALTRSDASEARDAIDRFFEVARHRFDDAPMAKLPHSA